eukprot:TRINITY_DN14091_c0_g2_i1.p1 TRINITY_DN14091_c0_g2~~TRINITY_DN14091_c0_g2_i1.p1  ORF type:complete len:275 (+),score=62.79 TRINITY_DN14091_c0_g2_i1:135-959(+)
MQQQDQQPLTQAAPLPYVAPPSAMGFQTSNDPDGIAARRCTVDAKSFGKGAAKVTCQNRTRLRQGVRIPRGYMFQPEKEGYQTLMAEKDIFFEIEPGQTASREIDAFCGYSKGGIPRGTMLPSGWKAPSSVLSGQQQVWMWTRAWERSSPRASRSSSGGLFSGLIQSFMAVRPAAQEARVLQSSYGIDAKQYKALQEKLEKIDKNPKQYQRNASQKGAPASARTQPSKTVAGPASQPRPGTTQAPKTGPDASKVTSTSTTSGKSSPAPSYGRKK